VIGGTAAVGGRRNDFCAQIAKGDCNGELTDKLQNAGEGGSTATQSHPTAARVRQQPASRQDDGSWATARIKYDEAAHARWMDGCATHVHMPVGTSCAQWARA
jgi:hypothetical protein